MILWLGAFKGRKTARLATLMLRCRHWFTFRNSRTSSKIICLIRTIILREYCRSTPGQNPIYRNFSNKELLDCLKSKKMDINPLRQEDSTEFSQRLLEEAISEMSKNTGWRSSSDVKGLLKANIVCTIACTECGHENIVDYTNSTIHLEYTQAKQADTTISKKVHDLLRQRDMSATCTICQRETRSANTF